MATLNITSGTPSAPTKVGNGTFDMLWGMDQHDCIIENFKIISPPVNEMPKVFGCDRLTFRNGEIRGIRAQSGGHVEGIHINACHDLLFERVLLEDNDIFHVFITFWQDVPHGWTPSARIKFVQCRFGKIGPGGGFWSVMSPQDKPMEGLEFVLVELRTVPK